MFKPRQIITEISLFGELVLRESFPYGATGHLATSLTVFTAKVEKWTKCYLLYPIPMKDTHIQYQRLIIFVRRDLC